MSFYDFSNFKSASDPSIPYTTQKFAISTVPVIHDFLQELGLIARYYRIVNNDQVNVISFVTESPGNPSDTVPPASEADNYNWTSYISITPNSSTGKGLLEVQLVKLSDAKVKK